MRILSDLSAFLSSPDGLIVSIPALVIGPDELIVGQPEGEGQLIIYPGTPAQAVDRERDTLLVGLLGAILAIGAAMLMAAQLSGVLG